MPAPREWTDTRLSKPLLKDASGLERREIIPEWLDHLDSADPLAIAARADLRRLNGFMGHAEAFRQALRPFWSNQKTLAITELGCGDGFLIERILTRMPPPALGSTVTLLDLRPSIPPECMERLTRRGWKPQVFSQDVFQFLKQPTSAPQIVLANLFLHHFTDEELSRLFRLTSQHACGFVAMEPRRAALALLVSKCLRLIGCNRVTRHDAPISVRAGFQATELSALWPDSSGWELKESECGLFSHAFIARRIEA